MININSKKWSELMIDDIQALLDSNDGETFFFEFKSDRVSNKKMIEEISALANTYGGYIIIGVEDDKTVSGCQTWDEQRIHTLIHDAISPVPSFDVKKFIHTNGEILVIKIDEGILPPYITNTGKICERISSGSFPINDSSKLNQLYYKNKEHLEKIKNKIYIEELENIPNNLCAYLDLGFSLNVYDQKDMYNRICNSKLDNIIEILKNSKNEYSVTKVGKSIVISVGTAQVNRNGEKTFAPAAMHNFIEIMPDGSVKSRIILYSTDDKVVSITPIMYMTSLFQRIYKELVGEEFSNQFISAYKYEELKVYKQFVPIFTVEDDAEYKEKFEKFLEEHKNKYGNNLILASNRLPKNDFIPIDKKYLSDSQIPFETDKIIEELFYSYHMVLGYIDSFSTVD